ncbi:MAG: hypothetical protein KJ882_01140, partial [Proteobacteria bacterium]|nr:hypothetical protein [Pseudomonadota bacterium]
MKEFIYYFLSAFIADRLLYIAGSLLLLWIGYRLTTSKSTKDKQLRDFNNAAKAFRVAFVNELSVLENPVFDAPQNPY